jgi:hypothetical protein
MVLSDTTRAGVEDELREAMLTGRLVDWRTGDAPADDPAHGDGWDSERTVAADLLAELLTDAEGLRRPRRLRLAGARIVGRLDLEATELVCPLLLEGCWFEEPLVLAEAQVPALRLAGCHLPSLFADGLRIHGNLDLSDGFTTGDEGEVALLGAHIGGRLDLSGATLTNPEGYALVAARLTVAQDMFCSEGFRSRGEVNLQGAQIGGQLNFTGATLTNADGPALQLQDVRAGALILHDLKRSPALADFTHAQIGVLVDDPASWPHKAILEGFIYDALYERDPISAGQRLGWLARNPRGYSPQPYEQLAAVYRRAGRDQDARTVAIAKQRARRRTFGRAGRLWSLLLDSLVGYGYRTWQAGVWLALFWLAGWAVFDRAHAQHELIVAKPGETHPSFHGAVYALDTLLPVVDLRQQEVWIPRDGAQWWAWTSILVGWILTTAVVTVLTGLLNRYYD